VPLFRKPGTAGPSPAPPSPPAAPAAPAEPPPPPVQPLAGDPTAHRIKDDLALGRWQDFHDFLAAIRDWERRRFYLDKALDGLTGVPDWMQQWVAARPDSALPYLFRGMLLIDWAWDARGGGWAKTVQEDAWAVFHGRLVQADRDLARAAALDEADPTPHAKGLVVAKGLSLGLPEIKRRFGEVTRRDQWFAGAYYQMVECVAAKWAGSHEEMFGFARWTTGSAPDGSPLHRVVATAHLERWLYLPRDTENGAEVRKTYFRREEVRAEIRQAALRSVYSPRYVPNGFTASDRNLFAMCFGLMGDYAAQLDQMSLIGPLIQAAPWQYQGSPGRIYERARTAALASVHTPEAHAWRPADPALTRR
jgi:hypothetical protein